MNSPAFAKLKLSLSSNSVQHIDVLVFLQSCQTCLRLRQSRVLLCWHCQLIHFNVIIPSTWLQFHARDETKQTVCILFTPIATTIFIEERFILQNLCTKNGNSSYFKPKTHCLYMRAVTDHKPVIVVRTLIYPALIHFILLHSQLVPPSI